MFLAIVGPNLVLLVVFTYRPLIENIRMSFYDWNISGLGPAPDFYQQPGWAMVMITVTYLWKNVGCTFVIYLAALQGRRADLDEAALIDGVGPVRHFRRVLLPQLRPTTYFLSITVKLNSLQVFVIISVIDPRRAARQRHHDDGVVLLIITVLQERHPLLRRGDATVRACGGARRSSPGVRCRGLTPLPEETHWLDTATGTRI